MSTIKTIKSVVEDGVMSDNEVWQHTYMSWLKIPLFLLKLELPLSWRDIPAYRFVRINSGHLEFKDNLPAKSE